jgi:hypothetical protein
MKSIIEGPFRRGGAAGRLCGTGGEKARFGFAARAPSPDFANGILRELRSAGDHVLPLRRRP